MKINCVFKILEKKQQDKNEGWEQTTQLNQRTDTVINGLNQIGLRAVALNDEELIELFYNLYNPATVEKDLKSLMEKIKIIQPYRWWKRR